MKKQDILEKEVNTVFLSIGSNLGDKKFNIELTKTYLVSDKIRIISSSCYYRTPSWPDPNFPEYINIILKIKTKLSLKSLFVLIKKIEKKIGKRKRIINYPRKCDIDIIDYNQKNTKLKINRNELVVPHPRMHTRNFVLFPLFELESNWTHPKSYENIADLLKKVPLRDIRTIKLG